MGGIHHRVEVLLIGLALLLVAAIVVVLTVMRPAPSTAIPATPALISTRVGVQSTDTATPLPTPGATIVPTAVPTLVPATIVAEGVPLTVVVPTALASVSPEGQPSLLVQLQPALRTAWPWLLLAIVAPASGLLALRRRRRRRLGTSSGCDLPDRRLWLRPSAIRLPWMGLVRPRLQLPALLTHLRLRRVERVTGRRLASLTPPAPISNPQRNDGAVGAPALDAPAPQAPVVEDRVAPIPTLAASSLGDAIMGTVVDQKLRAATLAGVLDAQIIELPEIEPAEETPPIDDQNTWTAEDRVVAVAGVLAAIWAEQELSSPVVAFDTPQTSGDGLVLVTLDQHPDEEEALLDLAEHIRERHPAWSVTWRRDLLSVMVMGGQDRPPSGGPLLAPILAHGRGGRTTRYYPLPTWRHLGIYGAQALGALHALLGSLLFTQPPTDLALCILDPARLITPLYQDVAHLVALPGSPRETLEELAQAIRRQRPDRGEPQPSPRTLMLVVVEPSDMLLNMLIGTAARLRAKPATPVHLLVVQSHLSSAGRELYAQLPALILSGGRGSPTLLPGQGDWPSGETARLLGRGMHVEGRPILLDEIATGQQLQQLRGKFEGLPPILWEQTIREAPSVASAEPAAPQLTADTTPIPGAPARSNTDGDRDAERQQRIVAAMIARRQSLIDGERVGAPAHGQADREAQAPQPVPGTFMADDHSALNGSEGAQEPPDQVKTAPPDDTTSNGTDAYLSAERAADMLVSPSAALAEVDQDGAAGADRAAASIGTDPSEADRLSQAAARLSHSWERGEAPLHLPARPVAQPVAHAGDGAIATEPAAPAPMVEPNNGWPVGPAPLGRVALAELLGRVVAAPAIVAGQPNELGVTKNRLVELLKTSHRSQAKELAEILMVWFDLAGLLVEPTRPGRLRHPRALVTTDLTTIAELLNATACPDKAAVQQAWAASNEGSV